MNKSNLVIQDNKKPCALSNNITEETGSIIEIRDLKDLLTESKAACKKEKLSRSESCI